MPPQPSLSWPQLPWQTRGTHRPHTFAVPAPPHVKGASQLPQLSVPPQPSLTLPQSTPSSAQLFGTQA